MHTVFSKDEVLKFIDYLSYEKRYSTHTIKSYKNDLTQFAHFIRLTYSSMSFSDIGHTHIRTWMVHLVEHKISSRSINRKLSTLRSFYNYLRKADSSIKNPTLKIIAPKIAKKLPEFVQEINIKDLFDNIIEGDFEDQRNRLIIDLFYSTGIRRIELINILVQDIDISNKLIKVLGKGNKERLLPLSSRLLSKILTHIENRVEHYEGKDIADNLFLTNKGKPMYPKLVFNIVKRYLSTVTTIKKKSPHVLRHSFATHLMNAGADLNAVKELLGHANLAATQIYTHNSIEKLKAVYQKAHPKSE